MKVVIRRKSDGIAKQDSRSVDKVKALITPMLGRDKLADWFVAEAMSVGIAEREATNNKGMDFIITLEPEDADYEKEVH